jgi:hypothetical protein
MRKALRITQGTKGKSVTSLRYNLCIPLSTILRVLWGKMNSINREKVYSTMVTLVSFSDSTVEEYLD